MIWTQTKLRKIKNAPPLSVSFLSILILVLTPIKAFADDSLTYSIAAKMIDTTENFTLDLFFKIAEAYQPLYVSIATIGLVLILSKYLFTRVPPIREMMSFTIAMTLASAIAFDPNLFK